MHGAGVHVAASEKSGDQGRIVVHIRQGPFKCVVVRETVLEHALRLTLVPLWFNADRLVPEDALGKLLGMAKTAQRLTALGVKHAKAGMHPDGNGLYLRVSPAGSASWVALFRLNGKRREIGLGSSRLVSLIEAREQTVAIQRRVRDGFDPILERRTQRRSLESRFGSFAERYIDQQEGIWKSAVTTRQWRNTLRTYCEGIWDIPISTLTTDHLLSVLQPIWTTKPEIANRVRARSETIFDAAKAAGLREGENPARWKGNLKHWLRSTPKLTRGHHPALPYDIAPSFFARLSERECPSSRALQFTICTGMRTSEVLGAVWGEVDIEAGIWSIPKERMKGRVRGHRVPLACELVALLGGCREPDQHLFEGPKGRLSSEAMRRVLQRMGVHVTVHGFRSTFRDWVGNETTYASEIAESAIAHVEKSSTVRAYRRSDALELRRSLMNDWYYYLSGQGAKFSPNVRF